MHTNAARKVREHISITNPEPFPAKHSVKPRGNYRGRVTGDNDVKEPLAIPGVKTQHRSPTTNEDFANPLAVPGMGELPMATNVDDVSKPLNPPPPFGKPHGTISCTHCGWNTPDREIPIEPTTIACGRCNREFTFPPPLGPRETTPQANTHNDSDSDDPLAIPGV